MLNGRKTIGIFMSGIAGTFRRDLCHELSRAGTGHGFDLLFFNFVGTIGADYIDYGVREDRILDVIPFDKFDGMIFDNNNVFIDSVRDHIHDRLMSCRCPVISISEPCKDFFQVCFDNSSAIKEFVHHFVNEHGFTRIGYMSGIKGHPDAVERLNAFGDAMEEHGLPREGAGVFHGDFWYNKQYEAAEFFIKKCGGLPQAIVCANDFMALSLCNALADRGIRIPQDVCISGYDDVDEARTHIPSISTASQDKSRLADSIFSLFDKAISSKSIGRVTCIPTTNIYRGSCGCGDRDLNEPEDRNLSFRRNINLLYNIYDAEAAMLSLTGIDRIKDMEAVFEKHSLNFGRYTKFFLFAYTDEVGRPSYDSAFSEPTNTVTPAIWIDRTGTSKHMKIMSTDILIPPTDSPEPQCYYLTHLHFGEHCFGYSVVMMEGNYPFNEFYNIWTVNLAVAIETLMQRNSINALLCDLEKESTHDRLTGLLNRSGFEDKVHSVFDEHKGDDIYITAVMIDMDRLKYINDIYGHGEGDIAISAMGKIIYTSCDDSVICGRTGGDEFYAVMFGKDTDYAQRFVDTVRQRIALFNETSGKGYTLSASCGISGRKASEIHDIDILLQIADERMYVEKRSKHVERD